MDDTADQHSCGNGNSESRPVTVAGGSIKVKDEVHVGFEIVRK